MSRRPARFTQADLSRAIRAIDQAEAKMMIEVLPDGTMRISHAPTSPDTAAHADALERIITL